MIAKVCDREAGETRGSRTALLKECFIVLGLFSKLLSQNYVTLHFIYLFFVDKE